ncbi:MAG: polysaccharide biosynthesis/export family protein [Pseudomonadota bacterium]
MASLGRSILLICSCLFGAVACAQAPVVSDAGVGAPAGASTGGWAAAGPGADAAAAAETESRSRYRLSTGDVISITVYGEDDLKREKVRLTDAGTVSYPVLGELQVRGKTVSELEKIITDGLRGTYLVNPRVAVTIDEYRPYFISGQVTNNGSFPYQPGLTVRKAVSIAGGFKERASQSKITIVRDGDTTNTPIKADLNTPVQPGDAVTVGESFF